MPPAAVDLLLRNAAVVDGDGLRADVDIAIRGEEIVDVGPESSRPAAVTVDCRGLVLVPGSGNAHHHLVTGLLRGAPPPAAPTRNQRERLERVVWPFERRLTHTDVRAAIRIGLLEAIVAGTTLVIDHHVSSGCIPGVLGLIAEEFAAAGVRGILCYEITDRDGEAVAAAGLAETDRFLSGGATGERIAGMVGLHALSTVGHETLARAVALAERHGVGLHLHLGESTHDNDDSLARYGARPVPRLLAAGGLSSTTLLAHAIHVDDDEARLLGEAKKMVAHLPRSNAANGVGVANLAHLQELGCTLGLGGDGFTQEMRAELALFPLLQRQERRDPTLMPPRAAVDIGLAGNAAIAARLGHWRLGRIAVGYTADLVALRYETAVPLLAENALWHLAAGFPHAAVRHVWIGGRPVLRDGVCLTIDAERARHDAAAAFARLWGTGRGS
jgi:cytosine/adenosine deaminase-related metal-dependent hydrolase